MGVISIDSNVFSIDELRKKKDILSDVAKASKSAIDNTVPIAIAYRDMANIADVINRPSTFDDDQIISEIILVGKYVNFYINGACIDEDKKSEYYFEKNITEVFKDSGEVQLFINGLVTYGLLTGVSVAESNDEGSLTIGILFIIMAGLTIYRDLNGSHAFIERLFDLPLGFELKRVIDE